MEPEYIIKVQAGHMFRGHFVLLGWDIVHHFCQSIHKDQDGIISAGTKFGAEGS